MNDMRCNMADKCSVMECTARHLHDCSANPIWQKPHGCIHHAYASVACVRLTGDVLTKAQEEERIEEGQ